MESWLLWPEGLEKTWQLGRQLPSLYKERQVGPELSCQLPSPGRGGHSIVDRLRGRLTTSGAWRLTSCHASLGICGGGYKPQEVTCLFTAKVIMRGNGPAVEVKGTQA